MDKNYKQKIDTFLDSSHIAHNVVRGYSSTDCQAIKQTIEKMGYQYKSEPQPFLPTYRGVSFEYYEKDLTLADAECYVDIRFRQVVSNRN